MDVFTIQNQLRKFRISTHDQVQERLLEIGEKLDYYAIPEYEVPNLVKEGRVSKIDVVWRSRNRIAVAFEVRMKKKGARCANI